MAEKLAIAHALTWTPDTAFYERDLELGEDTVEIFSPNGHRCELSMDSVRVLAAFGSGMTIDEVRERLAITAEESEGFLGLVKGLQDRGFLCRAADASRGAVSLAPTLLVSAHGCGATLLRWLIDSHPHVACAPTHRLGAVLQEMMHRMRQSSSFTALGSPVPPALRGLGTLMDDLLQLHARRRQKDRWVWSSRDHDRSLGFLDTIFEHNARYIVMIRHPFDAAESAARKQNADGWQAERMLGWLRQHETPQLAYAHYWKELFGRVRAFRELHADRMHVVRYEDLVRNPMKELTSMFGFLGLPTPDNLVDKAFRTPHEILVGGWESTAMQKATGILTDRVGLWHGWDRGLLARVQAVVESEMKHWEFSATKGAPS
jgi:protein-tyrosine sulfotransferase